MSAAVEATVPTLIGTVNAGSSSIKVALYALQGGDVADAALAQHNWEEIPADEQTHSLHDVVTWLLAEAARAGGRLAAVSHRVVHGGTTFDAPVRVNDAVLHTLDALVPLAPLHQPHGLRGIRVLQAALPDVPQIACFDTTFHRTRPLMAELMGLPYRYFEQGVRRYGFHGLSYAYIAQKLRQLAPAQAAGRVIVAHLGSGASLCAMKDGKSVESTMGQSALDGLLMGTRCGSIDPGVLIHLMQTEGMTARDLEKLLYKESGLLGLSGIGSDMRVLLASDAPRAQLALDFFVYRAVQEIGKLAVTLGGLDALVFTAGVGEHAAAIRARIAAGIAGLLGAEVDEAANAQHGAQTGQRIDATGSRLPLWVLPTDEQVMLARGAVPLIAT